MKEFFKKLGKKLKKFFGWVVYFLIILIWAVYDFFYNSKAHWKIFKMRLPQYLRFGAIVFVLFLIMTVTKKRTLKNKGENGSGDETGAANGGATAENADQTAAKKTADGTGGNDESQEKNDENRQ